MKIGDYIDKVEGFSELPQIEQVKLMAYFYTLVSGETTFKPKDINQCFINESLKEPTNTSHWFAKLRASKPPVFVNNKGVHSLHRDIKKELDKVYQTTEHYRNTSLLLRNQIGKVKGNEQQVFIEEAISCYEFRCYRAATMMTWQLAMDILYQNVINKNLSEFNAALQVSTNAKYKKLYPISDKDAFSDIKEKEFIELLRVSKIITNDVRKILVKRLDDRNSAAHPNTVKITEANANHFIEDLLLNVIEKYQL